MIFGRSVCQSCGRIVGWYRLFPPAAQECADCLSKAAAARLDAIAQYDAAAGQVLSPSVDPAEIAHQLDDLALSAGLSPAEDRSRRIDRIHEVLNAALADRMLTDDELTHYARVLSSFGVPIERFGATLSSRQRAELHIAFVHRGDLQALSNPNLLTRSGESVYLDIAASLLKEVVDREWQGQSAGVSVRVVRGVYVRRGQSRGHSVVIGSHMETADEGLLAVSNRRVVFRGRGRAIELPIPRILDMRVYDDGITFHVANRVTSPQFQIEPGWGDAVAATVNYFASSLA